MDPREELAALRRLAELEAKAAARAAQPAAEPPPAPSTFDVAATAPLRGLAGAADFLLNVPTDVVNLGIAGVGSLMGAAGKTDLPQPVEKYPLVTRALEATGVLPPAYQNMTAGQRIIDVGAQAAGGALLGGPRDLARNALLAGIGGVTGQTTTELTGSPTAGLIAGAVAPGALAAKATNRTAALQAAQTRNAVRDQTLRAAQAEGLIATPGSVSSSAVGNFIEYIAGKQGTQQLMSARNQKVVDRLARRAVGIAEDAPLNYESMRQVRQQAYKEGYEPIAGLGNVQTDPDFTAALDDVVAQYTGPSASFPGAVPASVTDLVSKYRVGQFDAKDAMGAMRTLRDSAKGNFRKGENELAHAQTAISNALEDQIERNLAANGTPGAVAMLDRFRAARQRMAVSHAVEDAIIEGSGSLDPRKLAGDLQRGKYLTGDLRTVAAFANAPQFRGVMQMPVGTPGISDYGMDAMRAAPITAGLGAAMGGAPGAMIGSAMAPVAPALARNYLLSQMAQRRLPPSYNTMLAPLAGAGQNYLVPYAAAMAQEQERRNALAP